MDADGGRQLTLQTLPMPADTIADNYISAGWLLSQMDLAGGRRAHDYTGARTVTVGLNAMSFRKPVFVGDLVSIYTEVVRQGRTSLTLKVESWAHRRGNHKSEKVTEGLFTFVQIDKNHKPTEIKKILKNGGIAPAVIPVKGQSTVLPGKGQLDLSLKMDPMPRDVNYLGDVFGGWILSQMDLACASAAKKYVGNGERAATVGIEAMTFHKPVFVGDEVSFQTEVVKTGNTSVTVRVETWSKRRDGQNEKVTEGLFTYVALDKNRKPVPVKPLEP